jgi:hypothetical protein
MKIAFGIGISNQGGVEGAGSDFNEATWFVSNSGNGGNDGHSSLSPIDAATLLTKTIVANDTIYFNRGDSFEMGDFDLTVAASILPYGSGADPILRGSTDISGLTWTDEGGGIYSTPMVTDPKWIWIDGECAKLTETARIPIVSRGSDTTITISHAAVSGYSSIVDSALVMK